MEENTVKTNEFDERESEDTVSEETEGASGGYFVTGVVGGFLAYAVVSVVKKLGTFVKTKLVERKLKKEAKKDDSGKSSDAQDNSGEETSDN